MARPKPEKKGDRAQLLTTRSLQTLSKEGLGAILPLADHWSTRGDASWRRAPWRQAIRPPFALGMLEWRNSRPRRARSALGRSRQGIPSSSATGAWAISIGVVRVF